MGKLTTLEKLELSQDWYFEETYRITFPNTNYPYSLAIHRDTLNNTSGLKISIRKWIEENIDDIVLMAFLDKGYFHYYDQARIFDGGYQQSNYWVLFHFEKEESALMFKLRFGEYIKEITDKHPHYLGKS